MSKEKSFSLIRNDEEVRYLIMTLRVRFMYTSIALSDDKEVNITYLSALAEADPNGDMMASRFFGRRDN